MPEQDLNLSLFVPSRKRDPLANAMMGASGKQPGGNALPSLIRGSPSSVAEHVAAASAVFPTAELITAALSNDVRSIAWKCAFSPDSVVSNRTTAIEYVSGLASRLDCQRSA